MKKLNKMAVVALATMLVGSNPAPVTATAKNAEAKAAVKQEMQAEAVKETPAKAEKPAEPMFVSELTFSAPKQSKESIDAGWRSIHGKVSDSATAPATEYRWRGKTYSYDEMVNWCLSNTNIEDNYFGVYAEDVWCAVGKTYEKTVFDYENKVYENFVIEFEAENATGTDITVKNSKGNDYSFKVITEEACTDKYGTPIANRKHFVIEVDSTGFRPDAFGLKPTGMIVSVGNYASNLETSLDNQYHSWDEEKLLFWERGFLGCPHFSQPVFFQWEEFNPGHARIIRYNKDICDYEWVIVEK